MKISQPTPELPVPDVRAAQRYYRDRLGFDIAWYHEEGRIGAVSHGECAIFFREREVRTASVFWVFCDDVAATHADLARRGADILGPPETKPLGLRQFTVQDPYGNRFHFFHDAPQDG